MSSEYSVSDVEQDAELMKLLAELPAKFKDLADLYARAVHRCLELDPDMNDAKPVIVMRMMQDAFQLMCTLVMDRVEPDWHDKIRMQMEEEFVKVAEQEVKEGVVRH